MSADQLDRLDYYALLQVDEEATADAIREAFHAFALRFHPDRFSTATESKRERASQIYRRGAEGYRVLMNPVTRRRYDEGLRSGELRLRPSEQRQSEAPSAGSSRLSVRSPRARPFATKAMQALKNGDLKTARLNLKMALQHEPDNALLRARLTDVERRLKP